jgi:hypothetical protein
VIAHKYSRKHRTYINKYIDNITLYYTSSLILIVDNNSEHICDIQQMFNNKNNVIKQI